MHQACLKVIYVPAKSSPHAIASTYALGIFRERTGRQKAEIVHVSGDELP